MGGRGSGANPPDSGTRLGRGRHRTDGLARYGRIVHGSCSDLQSRAFFNRLFWFEPIDCRFGIFDCRFSCR